MRERLSLESSLDSVQDELQSAHKKFDYEARWRLCPKHSQKAAAGESRASVQVS